jgi:hypothetical protein
MKRHRVGKGRRRHPIRIVSSWDAALSLLDGKTIKDNEGIEGTFKVDRSAGPYRTKLMHVKTPKGRATEQYQAQKRQYRDDWDTDFTHSEDLTPILNELGIRFTTRDHKTGEEMVQRAGGKLRSMRGARGRT